MEPSNYATDAASEVRTALRLLGAALAEAHKLQERLGTGLLAAARFGLSSQAAEVEQARATASEVLRAAKGAVVFEVDPFEQRSFEGLLATKDLPSRPGDLDRFRRLSMRLADAVRTLPREETTSA